MSAEITRDMRLVEELVADGTKVRCGSFSFCYRVLSHTLVIRQRLSNSYSTVISTLSGLCPYASLRGASLAQ
jgi:hypothetical protein